MIRKEGSKHSEGGSDLQSAENQNLGLPKTDRRSNFLYISMYHLIPSTYAKMHTLYEKSTQKV